MNILVVDNYDSFTYNIVYLLRHMDCFLDVKRNDKVCPEDCDKYNYVVLSPGPGIPEEAGNLMSIIEYCAGKIPVLGICLGMQAIGIYLGGKLINLEKVQHGVASMGKVVSERTHLFKGMEPLIEVGRYHSWELQSESGFDAEVTMLTDENHIMAIENIHLQLYGVQFHPESILTPSGSQIIKNFLNK